MTALATLPRLRLLLDRQPAPDVLHLALIEVVIRQRLSQPTICELLFADGDGRVAEELARSPGDQRRTIMLHAEDRIRPLFSGSLSSIDYAYEPAHGPSIRLRATDPLETLQRRQPVRGHVQLTLPEIAAPMVADLGLGVRATARGPLWQAVVQHDRTDFTVLADLAERSGLYFFVTEDTLSFFPLSGDGEPAVELVLGATLLSLRASVDVGETCGAVTVVGWDPWRMSRQVASARAPGGGGERTLAGRPLQSEAQGRALAQGELDRMIAARVAVEGTADGDPELRPGRVIVLGGVAPAAAGRHVLSAVTHRIDTHAGYVSTFETKPPAVSLQVRPTQLAPGVVSRIDDPERLGRVRITLPGIGGIETAWLQVLTAAAGAGKGLIALPDVGDHVIALLADGDPGQGVVIGSAFGEVAPVDSGADEGAVRRFTFATAGGQKIRLDDGRNSLQVETADGSRLEMGPDGVNLHATHDLDIAAPGHRIRIRGGAIDFEQA